MKKILIAIAIVVIGIQFIPAKRTNPEVTYDFDGPPEVKRILKKSCYDCHSNETDWPWYSYIAPASWLVSRHVEDGRRHLNFSEWEAMRAMGWVREEIHGEVAEGAMPIKSYLLLHADANVTADELAILKAWAEQ